MKKQRGYPDRRGMGAESDFVSEQFVPSERYKAQQQSMIETLLAAGIRAEEVAALFNGTPELRQHGKDEEASRNL